MEYEENWRNFLQNVIFVNTALEHLTVVVFVTWSNFLQNVIFVNTAALEHFIFQ